MPKSADVVGVGALCPPLANAYADYVTPAALVCADQSRRSSSDAVSWHARRANKEHAEKASPALSSASRASSHITSLLPQRSKSSGASRRSLWPGLQDSRRRARSINAPGSGQGSNESVSSSFACALSSRLSSQGAPHCSSINPLRQLVVAQSNKCDVPLWENAYLADGDAHIVPWGQAQGNFLSRLRINDYLTEHALWRTCFIERPLISAEQVLQQWEVQDGDAPRNARKRRRQLEAAVREASHDRLCSVQYGLLEKVGSHKRLCRPQSVDKVARVLGCVVHGDYVQRPATSASRDCSVWEAQTPCAHLAAIAAATTDATASAIAKMTNATTPPSGAAPRFACTGALALKPVTAVWAKECALAQAQLRGVVHKSAEGRMIEVDGHTIVVKGGGASGAAADAAPRAYSLAPSCRKPTAKPKKTGRPTSLGAFVESLFTVEQRRLFSIHDEDWRSLYELATVETTQSSARPALPDFAPQAALSMLAPQKSAWLGCDVAWEPTLSPELSVPPNWPLTGPTATDVLGLRAGHR